MAVRFVQQERAFDSMFDPCFCSSAMGAQQYYREGPAYGSGLPVDTLQNTENLVTAVQGANRYKYMKRPIVPFLHAVPPDILLAPPTVTQQDGPMGEQMAQFDDAPTKTIGTQSDMRESEAQTDPFTPDYVVKEGETPEVLTLTAFKHGNGLPMGLREVELVERARLKRTVEASFPPVTDDRSFALRAQMMEALETKQWADREADLKRDQDARLEKLEEQLQQRSDALEAKHEARVDQLRQVKLLQSENEVAIVQKRRIKAFRKLTEAQKHMVPGPKERDVVEEYASYGSKVYAPIRREGQSIIQDKNAERFETNPPQLASLEGMQSLEQQLPTNLIKSNANKALMATNKGGTAGRRALVEAQHLDKVHKILKNARLPLQKDTFKEQILKRYHKPPPLERPPTPTVEGMQEESSTPVPFGDMADGAEVEVAVIMLQRLLRGRMVQNMVYDAKEKRRELIEELRSVEQLEGTQEAWEEARANAAKTQHDITAVDSAVGLLQGDAIGRSLDYLSKELVHRDEEARLRAIMEQAEKMREDRESAETKQRESEEAARGIDDQIYLQLHECHQRSVDNYLDVLISNVMEDSAEERALADVRTKAEKLDTVVEQLESKYDATDSVMQDLVAHFLLPEVEREEKRWKLREKENKYKKAAYDAAYDFTGETGQPKPKATP